MTDDDSNWLFLANWQGKSAVTISDLLHLAVLHDVKQDLTDFKSTGRKDVCLALPTLLANKKGQPTVVAAMFEAADIYRLLKTLGRSGNISMGNNGKEWKKWRKDIKTAYKSAGSEDQLRKGREFGRRLMAMEKSGASAALAFGV